MTFNTLLFVGASQLAFQSIGPVSWVPVANLTAKADAIVLGTVQSASNGGAVHANITVERALKGSLVQGSSISIIWRPPVMSSGVPPTSGSARTERRHGLFFLQRSSGTWSLLPRMNGNISWQETYFPTPASSPPGVRKSAEASLPVTPAVLDRVYLELVIAIEAGASMPVNLATEFRIGPSAVLAAAFLRFLNNPKLQAVGLRGIVIAGEPAGLVAARDKYTMLSKCSGWTEFLGEITLNYLNTTPQAIRTLGQVATDVTVADDLRLAISGALARMHTSTTLPYLAQLLADYNPALRGTAAGGMSGFANNVPIGAHEPAAGPWPYRTDETIRHIGFDPANAPFWQGWWRQYRAKLNK